ncbi:C39 family peptidase [Clostridium sp. JN-1]|uniref:C39 family peptidase n=1 Tax=Clostridium sp. JN-1 TaxID=2483110 RepID=UPI000F0AF814|nr:C39 family peptidase [Clostridium sp. JN-1]
MKKILAFFFSLVLLFSTCSFSVSAKSNSVDTNTSQYISLNDAKLLAKHTILTRISTDKSCPWKNGVSIGDVITMYDFDDIPNAYVFNLKQGNKAIGHILVDANANTPGVAEFSYDESFYLKQVIDKNFKNDKNFDKLDKKYYFISPYNILVKNTELNKDVFYDAISKQKISDNRTTLKADYKKIKQNLGDTNSINIINKMKSTNTEDSNLTSISSENSMQPMTTVYQKADVPYCDNATFYTTGQFWGGGNCAPTAGTSLIMYWYKQRGITNLVSSSDKMSTDYDTARNVFGKLYDDMKTDYNIETYPNDFYNGLLQYAQSVGCPAVGSDYISNGAPLQTIESNISNGNPVKIGVNNNEKYGDHAIVVFGYENNSDGNYLRLADGWTSSHQTWCTYSYLNPVEMAYARW